MPITIAICDDDKTIYENIMQLVEIQCADCRVDLYDSGNALLAVNSEYDIYILEIHMPNINGMRTAELIRKREESKSRNESIIIFVSTLKEYMEDAFDVKAYHYLVKPIDEEKFNSVLSRAINDCHKAKAGVENHVLIKSGNTYQKLFFKDIFYVESRDKKVIINSVDGVVEYYEKMQELENALDHSFFRCHRCYIVNLAHVIRYNANTIWLKNGDKIYLAQKKYTAFAKAFMIFTRTARDGVAIIDLADKQAETADTVEIPP